MNAAPHSTVRELIVAMRPKHWVKNVFVFAAPVFALRLGEPAEIAVAWGAFAVFCMLSSSVYLLNDIADRENDRLHPVKRRRPIAAGRLSVTVAAATAVVLATGGLAFALWLAPLFAAVAGSYLVMNLAYSLALKRVVILDVMLIAAGFLLRAWGGSAVLDLEVSNWLILCTGTIALFLALAKRRQEIASFDAAVEQRPILREYSLPFLDQMISIVTASTVLAYSLYAFSHEVAQKLGTRWLGLTIPFVLYGIFRYLYLIHQRGEGENPTQLLLADPQMLATILLWGGTVVGVLYLR